MTHPIAAIVPDDLEVGLGGEGKVAKKITKRLRVMYMV